MGAQGAEGRGAWLDAVGRALKGRDVGALTAPTLDGIGILPLYTPADAAGIVAGRPGEAPFTRGNRVDGGWRVCQRFEVRDPAAANAAILADLEAGTDAIELVVDRDGYGRGVVAPDRAALETALRGVYLDAVPLTLDAGPAFAAVGRDLADLIEARGHDAATLDVRLAADPLGAVALGRAPPDGAMEAALAFAAGTAARLPAARLFRADGAPYHAAGASEAQELAVVAASATAYLRHLADNGFDPSAAAALIEARLACDADLFVGIAKLRALRRVWSAILDVAGIAPRPLPVTAITASRMFAGRDVYVNVLRATAAAMAGALGGAEAVTVLPFDRVLKDGDGFSRRVARNTQRILAEEGGLALVADPAGGSAYVERLSEDLAAAAWSILQKIEGEGGMLAALRNGPVRAMIEGVGSRRFEQVARRRAPLTGVSTFPDLDERRRPAPTREASSWRPVEGAIETPLAPTRLAEGFERLRDAAEAAPERPAVFLAVLGPQAEHNERATFAANAFAAGGIEAVSGPIGADPDAIARAFAAGGPRIACLCGTDDRYAAEAGPVAGALKAAGAERLYLAGSPDDGPAGAGIDAFLHRGSDLLGLLEDAHALLEGEEP